MDTDLDQSQVIVKADSIGVRQELFFKGLHLNVQLNVV
jgi:hypothetical protein